ncbi:MAG: TetR/AcrR family transcriptional regulator [Bacteroidota bacterium]
MTKANDPIAKDKRKQHILDSAESVLQHKGLDGLSISSLSKEAKLAQGTLYLYFKKKEDILAQLTVRSREKLLEAFKAGTLHSDNPLEQLRGILHANFQFYRDSRLYFELASYYEVSATKQEPPELYKASHEISAFVVGILNRAKRMGLIKSDLDTEEFSYLMWGTYTGMVQLMDVRGVAIAQDLSKTQDQVYKSFVDFMIDAIQK